MRGEGEEKKHDMTMQCNACKYLVSIWSHILSNVHKAKFFVHPQEDLAKFAYGQTMKVENFKNPFIFWLLCLEPFEKNW
jgi:hypothetical protein